MILQNLTRPANIAHRGARSLAPENTIAAARRAVEAGADAWELDVQVSADGELFILHDDTLLRTSNVWEIFPERCEEPAHTFSLAEIRQLDFGSWYNQRDPFQQIAAGNVSPEQQQKYTGEPAPTLREALEFTRDQHWAVNVEIKDASGAPGDAFVVEKTVALILELGMLDTVLISSFNHAYLRRVKRADARIATGALVEEDVPNPIGLVKELGALSYHPGGRALHPEMIPQLTQAGIIVYPWTINKLEDMRLLLENGTSGIITDFPQVLKQIS